MRSVCCVALFLTVACSSVEAQKRSFPEELREVSVRSSYDGTNQPALFFAPAVSESRPLLVALHTWSSGYRNPYNAALAARCVRDGWVFVHPHFRGPNTRPEACGSEMAVADVEDAVAFAVREANVDRSRIYLCGASGGGHMALLMAGRAPELWAGVSAWVPVSDLRTWYRDCKQSGRRYAADLVAVCGGAPGAGSAVDAEYRRRSPIRILDRARGLPIDIHAGIRDGHEGSVPVRHSLLAYNALVPSEHAIDRRDIGEMTRSGSVPDRLRGRGLEDPAYGQKRPLFRRSSGAARVTLFQGGHEMISDVAFDWLSRQKKVEPAGAERLEAFPSKRREVLFDSLIRECHGLDRSRAQRLKDALDSIESTRELQSDLREFYRSILGSFPAKTPLRPVVTGRLVGPGCRIEKVMFESLPNHRVTALLYLPAEGDGPWPGVLFACGHSTNGKAYAPYQKACTLLAQNGFVVLSYDPISQGERTQLPKAKRWGTTSHTVLNAGSLLVGRSIVWYEAWDGVRAIDYLRSRPEVDRARSIGMTGTSGGGTQTTFLMAYDERVGPAAPSCYVMRRTDKFVSRHGAADGCQHLPREGEAGIDHIDYAVMRAPKPTAVLAATRDFFGIDSTRRAAEDAIAVYGKLGARDAFHLFVADAEHGMHVEHRQAATRWMRKWFYGDDAAIKEPVDILVFKDAQLRVTRTGQVYRDFDDEVGVAQINLTLAKKLCAERGPGADPKRLRAAIAEVLGLRGEIPATEVRRTGQVWRRGYTIDRLVLKRAGCVDLPGLLFVPAAKLSKPGRATVWVHDGSKAVDAGVGGPIEQRVLAGEVVLAIDPAGIGEGRDRGSAPKYFNAAHRVAVIARHIGRPLLGLRVRDVQVAVGVLAARRDVDPRQIGVYAVGGATIIAAHAAALDARIANTVLRRTDQSIESFVEDIVARPRRAQMAQHVVPGALRVYDVPDLKRLTHGKVRRLE